MNVLIVDDSVIIQTLIKKALLEANEDIIIAQAETCKDALELFNSFGPDTVILDLALPDGSGINVLKKFKESNPLVKVAVFTNYPTAEFKKICMELNADHFIDKSNLNSLIDIIR